MKIAFSKRLAAVLGGLAILALPVFSTVSAATLWGPDRPTLTLNGTSTPGFDHVQFNSIVNNPNYGDERSFFDGKLSSNTASGGFQDTVQVEPGQELLLRAYVHNNADSSQNASGVGIARNTKLSIQLPTATATSLRATALISADNATPGTVFSSMDFQNSNVPFSLSYVPGSAVAFNNAHPQGMPLSDSIVSGGAPIGYEQADGNVPGCFQFVNIVTMKVKVNGPSLTVNKQVEQTNAPRTYAGSVGAKAGDKLTWLINYQNNSNVQVDHVVIRDVMPAHMTLVPGSVHRVDPNFPFPGQQLTDAAVFTNGVDVGSYAPNGGGYIQYQTTVNDDFAATDCNVTLTNTAFVSGQGVTEKSATATVNVTKTCQTTPPPTTPTTPLPQTGPESALAGIFGTGALGYATRAYLRSKRAVVDSLKGIAQR